MTNEVVEAPDHLPKIRARRNQSEAEKVRVLLEPHREALIGRAVELALAGDPQALRLCLERLAPTPRPEAEKCIVPGLADASTLEQKAAAILGAVGNGHVSAEAGRNLLHTLDAYASVLHQEEFDRRLAVLEGRKPRTITIEAAPADGSDLV